MSDFNDLLAEAREEPGQVATGGRAILVRRHARRNEVGQTSHIVTCAEQDLAVGGHQFKEQQGAGRVDPPEGGDVDPVRLLSSHSRQRLTARLVKGQGRPVALGVEGQGTVFFNQRPCRRLHRISAIPTRRRLVFRS